MQADLDVINKQHEFEIHFSFSFHLATKQMIPAYFLTSGSDYVEVIWTPPKYLPRSYLCQIMHVCTLMATSMPKHDIKSYVVTNTQSLSSGNTSIRILDLCPNSTWMLILLAVYNRASIDTGIVATGTTPERTSKRNVAVLI